MSWHLLAIVTALYLGQGVVYAYQHRYGMAFAFGAYALANVGFIIDMWEHN